MTYRFSIPDMSCSHCVKAVTGAIADADPKAETVVDLPTKTATVRSALPADALGRAIETAGYAATLTD